MLQFVMSYYVWSSKWLKSLDPFSAQKESAFTQSLPAITSLASYILDIGTDRVTKKDPGDQFSELFHVCFCKLLYIVFSFYCYSILNNDHIHNHKSCFTYYV